MTRCKPDRDGIACLTHSRLLVGLSYCSDGCRHERVLHVQLFPSKSEVLVRHDECHDCGAWLSLGPSRDDSPQVVVEIRALDVAELARTNDGADCLTGREKRGYSAYVFDDGWHGPCHYGDEQFKAGYLAAAIAAHDVEGS